MFKQLWQRIVTAMQATAVILLALPFSSRRRLLSRMITFSRNLPSLFNQPLPTMMAQLTPPVQNQPPVHPHYYRRQMADAVAVWHLQSPLGICLRRSLLRYHFLREADVPVSIVFGARFKGKQEGGGLGGHAWLTLNNSPYFENSADYEGFVEMYVYPKE